VSGGFVLIHRSLWDHPAFRNFSEAAAFAWMISQASWKPTRVRYKDRVIVLQRGQLAISYRDLARRLGFTKSAIERFLKRLKTETMIGTATGTGVVVISIYNYDKYQSEPDAAGTAPGQEVGQDRDTTGTQNNKLNKLNQNTPVGGASAPSPEKVLFDRGKDVLGKGGGGLIARLRKATGNDDALALDRLNEATDKSSPKEYLAKIIHNLEANGSDDAKRMAQIYACVE
jgi:hypothetical protein